MFATNTSGVKVWEASYGPFGGVVASSGPAIGQRFPGQWFQSETGLYQNWMRDYDPTLGRYLQADPLGLVDGASVYGYARQNPGRWTDPRGEETAAVWATRGFGSFWGGFFSCATGGCLDPRVEYALFKFSEALAADPELLKCVQLLFQQIELETGAAYMVGRVGGVYVLQGSVILATRGQTDRVSRIARGGGAAAFGLSATVGNISHFISTHGDPSISEMAQLFKYGRVLTDNLECGCGGGE